VKTKILFTAVAMCAMGCASTGMGPAGAPGAESLRADDPPSVRAGSVRVLDPSIDPLVPIHVAPREGALTVRFGHPREGALLELDAGSLTPVSPVQSVPIEARGPSWAGPAHTVLGGGRILVCWKRGDPLTGYRLMAQAWSASGAPLGAPVAVSSDDVDVVGSAQVVPLDGNRAVATFSAASGDRFELLAVPLEVF
jgi:hypothetical protein